MKPKGSLPRSEQPSTCLYTEPHDLVHAVYKIYGNIFPSLCFKRWFSFMLPFEILYAFVFTTYIADALLTSSLLIWSCHLYLVWSTKFEGSVSFSQTTCYSHPLQSKTFLSILFSWTLSAYVHTLIWENTHTHIRFLHMRCKWNDFILCRPVWLPAVKHVYTWPEQC